MGTESHRCVWTTWLWYLCNRKLQFHTLASEVKTWDRRLKVSRSIWYLIHFCTFLEFLLFALNIYHVYIYIYNIYIYIWMTTPISIPSEPVFKTWDSKCPALIVQIKWLEHSAWIRRMGFEFPSDRDIFWYDDFMYYDYKFDDIIYIYLYISCINPTSVTLRQFLV